MFNMDLIHFWIFSTCLLSCLTGCSCSNPDVLGFEGQDVTLPCRYDSHYHGVCEICWMRGSIPMQGCGDEILSTDGDKVVMRRSVRYQLQGRLQRGDVSLTILNARQSDSGTYGCRVHVPGWFNDEKYTIRLVVREAPVLTTQKQTTLTPSTTEQTTAELTTAAAVTTPEDTTSLPSTSQRMSTELTADILTPQEEASPFPSSTESATVRPTPEPEPTTQQSPSLSTSAETETTRLWDSGTTQEPEPTTQQSPSLSKSAETETTRLWDSGTTQALVNTEYCSTESVSEHKRTVDRRHDLMLLVILGSVLVVLVLVIIAVYLTWKQRQRFRTKLQINKNSAPFISYSNMDSSVALTMENTHGGNGGTEDELQA
ncbi:hepatitis A virus cellular receptor 1 homolog [Trichomycterus rosablanca]|uniref:hepatitis A virus cellular receptor 1 homolog n=1 Tax=Trichomycterus rosablanca TaxID=2290929 RepID=UPI002F34F424